MIGIMKLYAFLLIAVVSMVKFIDGELNSGKKDYVTFFVVD